jgi:hypothetical protein
MKPLVVVVLVAVIAAIPSVAVARNCWEQLAHASFFARLRPGPDTDEARRHLKWARKADSNGACLAELRAANFYAVRSMGQRR